MLQLRRVEHVCKEKFFVLCVLEWMQREENASTVMRTYVNVDGLM